MRLPCQAIASIHKKEDLLKVIFQKVQPLYGFYDIGLSIISLAENTATDWSALMPELSPSEANHRLHEAGLFTLPYRDSAIEFINNKIEKEGKPVIIQVNEDSIKEFPDFKEILEIELAHGYKEMWFTQLKAGGKLLGTLNFNSLEQAYFTRFDPQFFQAIADLVAVAVANILANEELKGKTQEKSLLLEISKSIASIQGKVQLLQTINAKLKPIFKFESTGLFIINEVENYHYDITVQHPDIDDSNLNRRLSENLNQLKIPHRGTAVAANYDELKESDSPIIVDFNDLFGKYPHPFAKVILEDGFIETMAGLLCVGGEPFGILFLNSKEKGVLTKKSFPLFKTITDQIAVATANILANEEILEREREKSMLLKVSQAIARTDNVVDLLRNIDELLQPVFQHCDAGVIIVDRDKKYLLDYHVLYADAIPSSPEAQRMNVIAQEQGQVRMPLAGSLIEWAMGQPPTMGKLADLLESGFDAPYLSYEIENGYSHYLCAPLTVSGNTFGFFNLLFKPEHQPSQPMLPLFSQMADIIAVALSNILANEEILEREREKTNLLSISEAISKINNRQELLRVVYQHIQPLFPFDSAGLFVMDKEKGVIYEILDSEAYPDALQKQLTDENNLGPWKLSRSNKKSWWMQQDIVINTVNQEAVYASGQVGDEQFKAGLAYGLKHMISGPMYANGKKIGAICFGSKQPDFYSSVHLSMFRSISGQVAVAVANILANEEIAAREKIKSIQVEIGKALAEETHWTNRLLRCTRLLQKEIPHSMLLTAVLTEDEFTAYGFYQTGKEEYQVLEKEDLQRILEVNPAQYKQYWQYVAKGLFGPIAYGQDEIKSIQKKYPLQHRFMNYFRLQHHLLFPMWLSNRKVVIFALYTKENTPYKASHIQLLNDIHNYIGLCFDRVLAFDELEKANQRITQENRYLQEEIKNEYNFDSIIGESRVLKEVFKNVSLVAATDTTVLVLGETGTGKELVARSLHNSSPRAKNSFIKINCAALPAQLIESELFGHEKGSFTGAFERRIGKFELADGGSIFLDEIGELPLELQTATGTAGKRI